jgi:RNA polymerase sigma-70 factor (ECF subfamily)
MAIINLRNFYYWYTRDEFVEVSDKMAAELFADKRYQKTHERTMRRHSVLSLDAQDGTEAAASFHSTDNPEAIFDKMDQHCRLCCALNSLPELQGRRIEAHYILGKSVKEIAKTDGAGERNVRKALSRGLASMKIYLIDYDQQGTETPDFCPDI